MSMATMILPWAFLALPFLLAGERLFAQHDEDHPRN